MEIMKIHWIRQNNEPLTLAERSNEIKKSYLDIGQEMAKITFLALNRNLNAQLMTLDL